jgi:hypothetical protein
MRLLQIQNQYLYEGLDRESRNTVMLWESAGIKLREAQLTADQIQQLFAEIEKGVTAGGSNRTMLGKGKDAASAVNKAWEDLKSKVQDSKPIKNIDAAFDQAVAKIEAGLGGPDNKVNQVIQKYRKFAKDRPISQSLIYAALIAAAGISGAGLGGAAVLGLLKMTDKLLQGEKFSSAAYAGGKTGALAYGAGQIGQAMRGGDAAGAGAPKDGETFGLTGKADNAALAKDMSDNPMLAQRAGVSNVSAGSDLSNQILDQSLENPAGRFAARQAVADALKSGDIDSSQAKELIKQIGSAATNPEAAEQAITQTLQNTGSSAASNATSSAASSISDKSAKYAWQLVQQKVDAGELDDPKALSSELNKSLNKAFSDYGVNPNSPEAEASKNAAKEVIAKAKDPEALLGKMQSGEVRPAGPAPDTLKGADALKAAGSQGLPTGAKMSPEYLQKVIDSEGSGTRFKISPEDAKKALDWQAQNGSPASDAVKTAASSVGSQGLPPGAKMSPEYLQKVIDSEGTGTRFKISPEDAKKALDWQAQNSGAADTVKSAAKTAASASADAASSTAAASAEDLFKFGDKTMAKGLRATVEKMSPEDQEQTIAAWRVLVGGGGDTQDQLGAGQLIKQLTKKYESAVPQGKKLSEGQVYLVFNRVCAANDYLLAEGVLKEGPMDFFKGAAAKGMQKLQGVGKNLTTKVTADKLNSAWRKSGSPTDSEELKSFLQSQGVDQTVVNTVYSSLKIKSEKPKADPGAEPKTGQSTAGAAQSTNAQTLYAQLKKDVMGLNKKEKQRIFAYLQKQLGTV